MKQTLDTTELLSQWQLLMHLTKTEEGKQCVSFLTGYRNCVRCACGKEVVCMGITFPSRLVGCRKVYTGYSTQRCPEIRTLLFLLVKVFATLSSSGCTAWLFFKDLRSRDSMNQDGPGNRSFAHDESSVVTSNYLSSESPEVCQAVFVFTVQLSVGGM